MASGPGGDARFRRLAAAAGGGLAVALSLPPWGWWPLAFVGVAMLSVAAGDRGGTRSRRAEIGFAFGAGWMFPGLAWMWFLTVPGYLIAATLFAALHAVAEAVVPPGRSGSIASPAAHTIVEAVRFVFPFGGVPLATLGISQASGPLLVLAPLGGTLLITWVVFQVGTSLAVVGRGALSRRGARTTGDTIGDTRRAVRPDVVALAVTAVVLLAAVAVPKGTPTGRSLAVAAVQGGGEQGTRALDVPSSVVTARHLETTASIDASDDIDLVVWPENAVDIDGSEFENSSVAVDVAAQASRLDAPIAVGVTIDSEYSAHPRPDGFVNAQTIITPDGAITSWYEKVQIVPFGEYVPLRGLLAAIGAPVDQIPSDAVRGRDPALLTLPDGTRLGVMISFEVFFGARGRAAGDGELLLNPTNGASYTWTIVQSQQIASSMLRAAETGRWVVQVAPTGFSAFVSPDGDVFDRTGVGERAVITRDVPLRSGATPYGRFGDLPWYLALGVVVAGLALRRRSGGGAVDDVRTPVT